jgi:hypothetical protein
MEHLHLVIVIDSNFTSYPFLGFVRIALTGIVQPFLEAGIKK